MLPSFAVVQRDLCWPEVAVNVSAYLLSEARVGGAAFPPGEVTLARIDGWSPRGIKPDGEFLAALEERAKAEASEAVRLLLEGGGTFRASQ